MVSGRKQSKLWSWPALACFMSKATPQTNHSQCSSPAEALNLIIDSKLQSVELDNSTIGVTCAFEAIACVASVSVGQNSLRALLSVKLLRKLVRSSWSKSSYLVVTFGAWQTTTTKYEARLPAAVREMRLTKYHKYIKTHLFDIMWASHLLCGRVCRGRVCLWANSLVSISNSSRRSKLHAVIDCLFLFRCDAKIKKILMRRNICSSLLLLL